MLRIVATEVLDISLPIFNEFIDVWIIIMTFADMVAVSLDLKRTF